MNLMPHEEDCRVFHRDNPSSEGYTPYRYVIRCKRWISLEYIYRSTDLHFHTNQILAQLPILQLYIPFLLTLTPSTSHLSLVERYTILLIL
jgi:hypothetical protein